MMTEQKKEPDMSSIHGRMSGSPRRVVDELEVEVTLRHVVKLQVTSPLTEELAVKEACHKTLQQLVAKTLSLHGKVRIIKKET
jgi:CMP-N-acetylneuraminic acid synthetase